jgi:hypothetical protein
MSAFHRYNDGVVPYICPACGYDRLEEPPWTDGSASDEICPSCGIQFGYDDFAGGDVDARRNVYAAWREEWRAGGMRWWSPTPPPPRGWDPVSQVRRVTEGAGEGTPGRGEPSL